MTQKLLLADSLDLLRQCEQREYDVDRTKQRIRSDNKYRNELGRLLQAYDAVYQQYVRGLRILNYVRHTALEDRDPRNAQYSKNLSDFCAGKMTTYMTRCDNILLKMDHILLPIQQVDLVNKEGYTREETIYLQDGMTYPLSRKDKVLAKEFMLMAGTYVLSLKNRDDYALAAPEVSVTLVTLPQRGSGVEPSRVELKLPCQCGWRKVIGIAEASTVQLEIRCSGIRDSHIDILLQKWVPIETTTRPGGAGGFANGPGPALSPSSFDSGICRNTCASVSKLGATPDCGGSDYVAGGYNNPPNFNTPVRVAGNAAAGPVHPQQPWASQLPKLPDDELDSLANYNLPSASLPMLPNSHKALASPSAPAAAASAEDPWKTLTSLNVPHAPKNRGALNTASLMQVPSSIQVNGAGLTCRQRLDKIREMLNAWPYNGVTACALSGDPQQIVHAVYALPMPRQLST